MDLSKISQIIIEVRARKEEACVMFPLFVQYAIDSDY